MKKNVLLLLFTGIFIGSVKGADAPAPHQDIETVTLTLINTNKEQAPDTKQMSIVQIDIPENASYQDMLRELVYEIYASTELAKDLYLSQEKDLDTSKSSESIDDNINNVTVTIKPKADGAGERSFSNEYPANAEEWAAIIAFPENYLFKFSINTREKDATKENKKEQSSSTKKIKTKKTAAAPDAPTSKKSKKHTEATHTIKDEIITFNIQDMISTDHAAIELAVAKNISWKKMLEALAEKLGIRVEHVNFMVESAKIVEHPKDLTGTAKAHLTTEWSTFSSTQPIPNKQWKAIIAHPERYNFGFALVVPAKEMVKQVAQEKKQPQK